MVVDKFSIVLVHKQMFQLGQVFITDVVIFKQILFLLLFSTGFPQLVRPFFLEGKKLFFFFCSLFIVKISKNVILK